MTLNLLKLMFTRKCQPGNSPVCVITRGIVCWKCQHSQESPLFCDKCRSIQNPAEGNTNYFKLFQLPVSYDVNAGELGSKFRSLQSYLHPDKFVNKCQTEKEFSNEYSSLANKAYVTLSDPIKRGFYMLSEKGKPITEKDTLDANFLLEIIELNEVLEGSKNEKDIGDLERRVLKELNILTENVSEAFSRDDLNKSKKWLLRMKYYWNILQKIKEKRQRSIYRKS